MMDKKRIIRLAIDFRNDEFSSHGAVINRLAENADAEDIARRIKRAGIDEATSQRIVRDVLDIMEHVQHLNDMWINIVIGDE